MIIAITLLVTAGLSKKERDMIRANFAKAEYRMSLYFLIGGIVTAIAIPLAALAHEY